MQDSFEVFAREVPIADTNHAVIGSFEKCCAGGIIGLSVGGVVRVALELHDEPLGVAVEVHDEAVEHVLAAKLQAEDAPVSQQRPRVALGWRHCSTQLTRHREPVCVREVPERIHGSKLAPGAAPLPTGTACEGSECCATERDRSEERRVGKECSLWCR